MVYEVPCEDCNQSYIGESGRFLEVTLAEHQRHVRKGDITRSVIAEHTILQVHRMDWESARVIDTSRKYWQRRVKETLHIAQREKKLTKTMDCS